MTYLVSFRPLWRVIARRGTSRVTLMRLRREGRSHRRSSWPSTTSRWLLRITSGRHRLRGQALFSRRLRARARSHIPVVRHLRLLRRLAYLHTLHLVHRQVLLSHTHRVRGIRLLRRDTGTGLLGLPSLLLLLAAGDLACLPEERIRSLHGHTTEVGNKVRAIGVAGDVALGAPSSVLPAQGQHVAAVAAPVRADVVDRFEPVGNAVVDFLCVILLYTTRLIEYHQPKRECHLRQYLTSRYTS